MKKLICLLMCIMFSGMFCGLPISFEVEAEYNNIYSYQDFTGQDLRDRVDITGTITGSCFYQECHQTSIWIPPKHIFPEDMRGVTFIKCNLDNVYIPTGNIVDPSCTHKLIKVQNDWDDWVLNPDKTPKEPMNKDQRIEKEVSILPKDIPSKKFTEEERKNFEDQLSGVSL